MNFQLGLIAKKIGMTQIFAEDGSRIPVTVLHIAGNNVTAQKTVERDGYSAIQVGYAEKKASRMTKPALGQFTKLGITPRYELREFRIAADKLAEFPAGTAVTAAIFTEGALVDVTGTSKGKGYQGVIKRHNMEGEKNSHGQHEFFRHGGSIGCRKTPGRVHRGKRMTGHMGDERVTVQNLKVARIDVENGLILVKGPVPGGKNGYVTIRNAIKPAIRAGKNAG